jgi:hypothetical protein
VCDPEPEPDPGTNDVSRESELDSFCVGRARFAPDGGGVSMVDAVAGRRGGVDGCERAPSENGLDGSPKYSRTTLPSGGAEESVDSSSPSEREGLHGENIPRQSSSDAVSIERVRAPAEVRVDDCGGVDGGTAEVEDDAAAAEADEAAAGGCSEFFFRRRSSSLSSVRSSSRCFCAADPFGRAPAPSKSA